MNTIEVDVNGTIIELSVEAYAATVDKMAFVSDELGLSIDSKLVERIDALLWDMTEGSVNEYNEVEKMLIKSGRKVRKISVDK